MWLDKLKKRWNLGSTAQVLVVLLVFACTGFSVFFLKRPLLTWIAGPEGNTTLATVLYYILILPIYNVLLLAWGFVFGQFDFFWRFEKRFVERFFNRRSGNTKNN